MILRVYAMWTRSRRVLYTLLFIHVSQVIITFVWDGIYTNPDRVSGISQAKLEVTTEYWTNSPNSASPPSVKLVHFPDFTHCTYSYTIKSPLGPYREVPRIALGITLFILAVIPTLKQSTKIHESAKKWKINSTMKLLVREGVLYFVVYVSFVPLWYFLVFIPHPLPSSISLKKATLTTAMLSPPLGTCSSMFTS